jgi:hypothetical protein
MMVNVIEIISPIGIPRQQESNLAPRHYEDLDGLRVGLLDNNKPNADKFLGFIGALLHARYPEIQLVAKRKMTRMESDGLAQFSQNCDVVINAIAD